MRTWALLGASALMALFGLLLGRNMMAQNLTAENPTLAELEQAAETDPFEWADYMLTYVSRVTGTEMDGETRAKADEYAARLGELDSNSIQIHLAGYYLWTDRVELGFDLAERYVGYVSSDETAWQRTFALLEEYEQDTLEYRAGVAHIADLLDAWNAENMGHIALNEQAETFITRMRG